MNQIFQKLALCAMLAMLVLPSSAQKVVHYDGDESATLSTRLEWASRQGTSGKWVGYSIERMMSENSYIGAWSTRSTRVTFGELLYGIKVERHQNNRASDKQVVKELVMLFEMNSNGSLRDVRFSTLEGQADLDGKDVVFLGMVDTDQSLDYVAGEFRQSDSDEVREELTAAIAMHKNRDAGDLLADILEDDDSVDVRSQAAFWLSQVSDSDVTVGRLIDAALTDKSEDVREQAVFAISQVESESATDALVKLARSGPADIRDESVFWLGQKASDVATKHLSEIIDEDPDVEVKKQAIFALAQQDSKDSVNRLVEIARTHDQAAVRKEAIFWLSQSDDPVALEAIIELARG